MNRVRPVAALGLVVLIAVGIMLAERTLTRRAALVHLSYPSGYQYRGPSVLSGPGNVSLSLEPGVHTLRFVKGGADYASVVDVASGGEIYATLTDDDLRRVRPLLEAR
jgi:hypothetical protein